MGGQRPYICAKLCRCNFFGVHKVGFVFIDALIRNLSHSRVFIKLWSATYALWCRNKYYAFTKEQTKDEDSCFADTIGYGSQFPLVMFFLYIFLFQKMSFQYVCVYFHTT